MRFALISLSVIVALGPDADLAQAGPLLPRGQLSPPPIVEPWELQAALPETKAANAKQAACDQEQWEIEAALPETLWAATSEQLWRWANSSQLATAERARCLQELSERSDPELPQFLVAELEKAPIAAWRDTLLPVTEWTQVEDADLRARLAQTLYAHAGVLQGLCELDSLGPALRRYATLIDGRQVGDFLPFLGDAAPRLQHQLVLQCIQTVFSVTPPPEDLDLSALRARVHELARRYVPSAPGIGAAQAAVAACVCRVAAILDGPELADLAPRLLQGASYALLWTIRDGLVRLARAWEAQSPPDAARLVAFSARIATDPPQPAEP